ncbi:MAG: hypothetical protein U0903_22595 [Planctomycetales bacterium]
MSERNERDELARNLATMIALMGLLVAAGGLVLLVMLVLPGSIQVLAMGMVFMVGMGFLHYFTWGRWLEASIKREIAERESAEIKSAGQDE